MADLRVADSSANPLRDGFPAPLRVAVIGVGYLGKHHARLLAGIEGARLTAVVDTDMERARAAVGESGAREIGRAHV